MTPASRDSLGRLCHRSRLLPQRSPQRRSNQTPWACLSRRLPLLALLLGLPLGSLPAAWAQNDALPTITGQPLPQSPAETHRSGLYELESNPESNPESSPESGSGGGLEGDLEGKATAEFVGDFITITPDGRGAITYSPAEGFSRLYRLDGTEVAQLAGLFQDFIPSGQRMITYAQGRSYLYDLAGQQQAVLEGIVRWSTVNGQWLITDSGQGQLLWLYSMAGDRRASFEGEFGGFTPAGTGLVMIAENRSRLYRLDGTEEGGFEGRFSAFTPDGEGLLTRVTRGDRTQTLLYDLKGGLQARFEGEFVSFSHRGDAIATTDPNRFTTWLSDFSGETQTQFQGTFIAFTADDRALVTYSPAGSRMYSLQALPQPTPEGSTAGQNDLLFRGVLTGLTTAANRLVTTDSTLRRSWLYRLEEPVEEHLAQNPSASLAEPIAQPIPLQGLFLGFMANEQRLLTSEAGSEGLSQLAETTYRLYDLDGNLIATLAGQLLGLSNDGQGIVLYSGDQSRIYSSLDGKERAAFAGKVLGFTADEQGVFVSLDSDEP